LAAGGGDDATDLLDGEDVGGLLLGRQAQVLERLPVARDSAAEEELDPALGDGQRAASEVALVVEAGEETADLRFCERVGRLAEVPGEPADGSHLGLAGAVGESGELEILKEAMAKSGHGRLLSERGFSERRSACELRRPSRCLSGHESRALLSGREPRGVRGSARFRREAASLNNSMQRTALRAAADAGR
jgi:hypothetical protein